jgi:hypothetical protein
VRKHWSAQNYSTSQCDPCRKSLHLLTSPGVSVPPGAVPSAVTLGLPDRVYCACQHAPSGRCCHRVLGQEANSGRVKVQSCGIGHKLDQNCCLDPSGGAAPASGGLCRRGLSCAGNPTPETDNGRWQHVASGRGASATDIGRKHVRTGPDNCRHPSRQRQGGTLRMAGEAVARGEEAETRVGPSAHGRVAGADKLARHCRHSGGAVAVGRNNSS